MAEYVDKEQVIEWFRPYGHIDKGIPYYGLATDVREMKAADVAPVRHGRWVRKEANWYCTECNMGYRIICGAPAAVTFEFCPNCGCKMDGVNDGG